MNQKLLIDAGLTVAQKSRKAFLGGVGLGLLGSIQDIALLGYQASNAGRGGFVPSIVGQSTAIGFGVPLAGFAAAGLSLVPGIGPLAAAVIAGTLSSYAELRFGSLLIKKLRVFTDLNKQLRHLEMGGSYIDTESAQRQRFLAIQDMNSAIIPSRRYLGQEARLMHR
jgi:hypothetical protein